MDIVITVVLLAAVGAASCAVTIFTHRTEKRGCGRGCVSCPNREFCHRGEKPNSR